MPIETKGKSEKEILVALTKIFDLEELAYSIIENLKYLFSWLFGEGVEKLPVIKESRDISNKLVTILRKSETIEHLKLNRDLEDAYELSDGEKVRLLRNLTNANRRLESSSGIIHRYKTEEVLSEVKKSFDTIKTILKILEE